jgi:hypothetical protein
MNASLAAIGRQLRAESFPAVKEPLPDELKDLLARLVAREAETQGSAERSDEICIAP